MDVVSKAFTWNRKTYTTYYLESVECSLRVPTALWRSNTWSRQHLLLTDHLASPISTLLSLVVGWAEGYTLRIRFAHWEFASYGKPDFYPYRHHLYRHAFLFTVHVGTRFIPYRVLPFSLTTYIHSLHHLLTVIVDGGVCSYLIDSITMILRTYIPLVSSRLTSGHPVTVLLALVFRTLAGTTLPIPLSSRILALVG